MKDSLIFALVGFLTVILSVSPFGKETFGDVSMYVGLGGLLCILAGIVTAFAHRGRRPIIPQTNPIQEISVN